MKKFVIVLLIVSLFFGLNVSAQESSSSVGGGGNTEGDSPLGVKFSNPSEGTIFNYYSSPNLDIVVEVFTKVESQCDFSGKVCNEENNCQEIMYRHCIFCNHKDSYFTSSHAEFDKVEGWKYFITATCKDREGKYESKIVSFNVEGSTKADTSKPKITILSPVSNTGYFSNTNFEFEVDELAYCGYTLATSDSTSGGIGRVSIPKFINNFKSQLRLDGSKIYTLTLECTDLNGNPAAESIRFGASGSAQASDSKSGGGISTTPSTSAGGGGTSTKPSTSSGGGGSSDSCPQYYTCSDGTQVDYCKRVKKETSGTCKDSDVSGAGPICTGGSVKIVCECVDKPESQCPSMKPSESQGGGGSYCTDTDNGINFEMKGTVVERLSSKLDRMGTFTGQDICAYLPLDKPQAERELLLIENYCDENGNSAVQIYKCPNNCVDGACVNIQSTTPESGGGIICKQGCIVDEKCVSYGTIYEQNNKKYYCDISNGGILQKEDGGECNNPYECLSNICEKNECGRYCDGCKDKNKNCIPYGTRFENNKYCALDKTIKEHKSNKEYCNNNYECATNLCVNSQCIEQSFINKIINWFTRLFGSD